MTSPLVLRARLDLMRRRSPTQLEATELIEKALQDFGDNVCVAWSGGRCSTAVLHMALKQKKDVSVVFNNTGVEFPDTVKYVHRIAEEWDLNFHELRPETTFWKIVKVHGFPQIRGWGDRPRRPRCCFELKEKPAMKFYRENEMNAVLTGIRGEESRSRAFAIAYHGQYYFAKRERIWKYHPISLWSMEDLQNYFKIQTIPLNPIYETGKTRCGCWPCTGYKTWRDELGTTHPKLYRWLNREVQKANKEPTLWEYADDEGCRQGEPEASASISPFM